MLWLAAGCGDVALTPPPPISSATNVLLLTLCTLRADHLGVYGYEGNTTPRIDRLAARGVLFREVLTPAPWTRASIAAMITGLYPRTLDIEEPGAGRNDRVLGSEHETLAEALSKAGYFTVAATANPNTNVLYNFDQGYDVYRDTGILWRDGYKEHKVTAVELSTILLEALANETRRPFFAHLVYVDVHFPYRDDVAERAGFALAGDGPTARYDRQLRFLDAAIGDLIDTLEARESRDLLVIINSDHGEGFGEVDRRDRFHGSELYDSTLWVPWIVSHPSLAEGPAGREITGLASGVDLVPTVLDLLGVPSEQAFDGISHADRIRKGTGTSPRKEGIVETRFLRASKSAIVTHKHKLIADDSMPGALRLELFDRKEGELVNRVRSEPVLANRLYKRLTAWQEAHPARSPAKTHTGDLSAGEAEALRALGYAE